ncbi:MAG TPA: DegT/DnrJ/EryC1/StrS family aminotransferase [Gemmata sp.]|nr:DegT/DnrJ/EryC1/StrS family aminotransferase [Gemmata sp.]
MSDTPAPVPLCDINARYRFLKAQIDAAVTRVLSSGQVVLGPEVAAFEKEAAAFCGAQFAVGCGSGTDALVLALHALGIGPGDEVIIPPFTFFASAGAVCRVGATPVFVDIDPLTFNLDPSLIEAKLSRRTKAVMPVHLFGQCCDMQGIWDIAEDHQLYVVEDAAQSFGSEYRGRRCGTLGVVAAMSFYPTKNLGAFGDAGLVTTNSPEIDRKLRALRVHGSDVKYYHKYIGYNMRLDPIHATTLRVQLPHVAGWLDERQAAARRYDKLIEAANLHGFMRRPIAKPDRKHTFNQYVVRVPAIHRDRLVKHLKDNSIGVEVYYPLSLHEQECFKHLGYRKGDFPTSEEAAATVLALPMFPEITDAQQRRVVEVCAAYMSQSLRRAA